MEQVELNKNMKLSEHFKLGELSAGQSPEDGIFMKKNIEKRGLY